MPRTCDGSWPSPCVIFDNFEHQISEVVDIRLQEVDRRGFLDVSAIACCGSFEQMNSLMNSSVGPPGCANHGKTVAVVGPAHSKHKSLLPGATGTRAFASKCIQKSLWIIGSCFSVLLSFGALCQVRQQQGRRTLPGGTTYEITPIGGRFVFRSETEIL